MMSAFASRDFVALGTGVTVTTLDAHRLDAAVAEVRDELSAFDHACSRFREDSDLEQLNRISQLPRSRLCLSRRLRSVMDHANATREPPNDRQR